MVRARGARWCGTPRLSRGGVGRLGGLRCLAEAGEEESLVDPALEDGDAQLHALRDHFAALQTSFARELGGLPAREDADRANVLGPEVEDQRLACREVSHPLDELRGPGSVAGETAGDADAAGERLPGVAAQPGRDQRVVADLEMPVERQ